jgi:amino acid permease
MKSVEERLRALPKIAQESGLEADERLKRKILLSAREGKTQRKSAFISHRLVPALCALVVLIGAAAFALPSLRGSVSTVVLITGICLLLFNFTSLQEYLAERRVRRELTRPAVEPGAPADNALVETTISQDEAE